MILTFLIVCGYMISSFIIPPSRKIPINSFSSFIAQQKGLKYSNDDTADIAANTIQPGLKLGVLLLNLGGPTKKEVLNNFIFSTMLLILTTMNKY